MLGVLAVVLYLGGLKRLVRPLMVAYVCCFSGGVGFCDLAHFANFLKACGYAWLFGGSENLQWSGPFG